MSVSRDRSQSPRREGVRYESVVPINERDLGIIARGLSRGEVLKGRRLLIIENGSVVSAREWRDSRNRR